MTPHTLDPKNQSRSDARIAYYDPIFGEGGTPRDNLHVLTGTTATKLLTELSAGAVRVVGVEVSEKVCCLCYLVLSIGGMDTGITH